MTSKKEHSAHEGLDGSTTTRKGNSKQNPQPGAHGIAKKDTGKHTKDDSGGAKKNTTKKQSNSI